MKYLFEFLPCLLTLTFSKLLRVFLQLVCNLLWSILQIMWSLYLIALVQLHNWYCLVILLIYQAGLYYPELLWPLMSKKSRRCKLSYEMRHKIVIVNRHLAAFGENQALQLWWICKTHKVMCKQYMQSVCKYELISVTLCEIVVNGCVFSVLTSFAQTQFFSKSFGQSQIFKY